MAARKRLPGESFKQYRKNLREEDRWLRGRVRGRVLWDSTKRGTFRGSLQRLTERRPGLRQIKGRRT
jgi:hypothetical protein